MFHLPSTYTAILDNAATNNASVHVPVTTQATATSTSQAPAIINTQKWSNLSFFQVNFSIAV